MKEWINIILYSFFDRSVKTKIKKFSLPGLPEPTCRIKTLRTEKGLGTGALLLLFKFFFIIFIIILFVFSITPPPLAVLAVNDRKEKPVDNNRNCHTLGFTDRTTANSLSFMVIDISTRLLYYRCTSRQENRRKCLNFKMLILRKSNVLFSCWTTPLSYPFHFPYPFLAHPSLSLSVPSAFIMFYSINVNTVLSSSSCLGLGSFERVKNHRTDMIVWRCEPLHSYVDHFFRLESRAFIAFGYLVVLFHPELFLCRGSMSMKFKI